MDRSRQLQDKTRIIYVLGFGVAYIGDFMEGVGWIVHYYCKLSEMSEPSKPRFCILMTQSLL